MVVHVYHIDRVTPTNLATSCNPLRCPLTNRLLFLGLTGLRGKSFVDLHDTFNAKRRTWSFA